VAAVHRALQRAPPTGLLRETGNLALVQDALGHSRPETTRVYAKMTNADLARAMTRPRSQPEPPPAQDADAEAQALARKIAALTPEQRAALRALLGEE